MKSLIPLFFLFLLIETGCRQSNTSQELKQLKSELLQTKAALAVSTKVLSSATFNKDYPLVHTVYFKTKPEVDMDQIIDLINELKGIPELKNLEMGTFKDLGDQRAMSDFGVVIQMNFADEAAYQVYQKHPIHLQLKEKAKPFLAGPPVTYDYLIE